MQYLFRVSYRQEKASKSISKTSFPNILEHNGVPDKHANRIHSGTLPNPNPEKYILQFDPYGNQIFISVANTSHVVSLSALYPPSSKTYLNRFIFEYK